MLALSGRIDSLRVMKRYLWLFAALVMIWNAAWATDGQLRNAQAPVYPEKYIQLESFKDGALELSTPVARYQNAEGRVVEMFGALHVAEPTYYDALNKAFSQCDVLLFEMIGGENLQREEALNAKVDETKPNLGLTPQEYKEYRKLVLAERQKATDFSPLMALLGISYQIVSEVLGLEVQNFGVDYSPENFVHADMTYAEFEKAEEEKGENLLTLAVRSSLESMVSGKDVYRGDTLGMALNFITGNTKGLKNEFIRMLAYADPEQLTDTVILESRNAKCMAVFDQYHTDKKVKHIGIFYGSAHLPGLHQELLKRGYQLKEVRWMPACSTVERNQKNLSEILLN